MRIEVLDPPFRRRLASSPSSPTDPHDQPPDLDRSTGEGRISLEYPWLPDIAIDYSRLPSSGLVRGDKNLYTSPTRAAEIAARRRLELERLVKVLEQIAEAKVRRVGCDLEKK